MTSTKLMKMFDWESVDSTTWVASVRYGRIPIYNVYQNDIVSLAQKDREPWLKYAELVNGLGFDWRKFPNRTNTYKETCQLSALTFMLFENEIRRKRGNEFKVYLANTVFEHFKRVKEWFDHV